MGERPGLDVLIRRLAERRDIDTTGMDLLAPDVLRSLAPRFGLHTADLFVIAGLELPEDLAPLDPDAGGAAFHLLYTALHWEPLPPERIPELHELVKSLPQQERTKPPSMAKGWAHFGDSTAPGGALMRLLCARNLGWAEVAKTFAVATPRYWSASTYNQVGVGRATLTPDWLADFWALLDLPAEDLNVLAGMEMEERPRSAVVAELIWDMRRLTAEQIEQVEDVALAWKGQSRVDQ